MLEDRTLPATSVLGSVWNELLADGRRGGEPGLAQTRVFLDLDHDGHFGSQRSAYNASTVQFTPGPFQAGDFITPLTPGGLPGDISDLNVRIDVTNNTTGGMLVGLFTPAGRLVGQGASLFTLGPGERFTGLIDDQAATPIGGASAPYEGEFRPLEPLTGPNAFVYGVDPGGTYNLIFFLDNPNPSGIQLRSWSLEFAVAEPSVLTADDGSYALSGLAAGTYAVGLVPPPGGRVTSLEGAQFRTVTVGPNDVVRGVDFGVLCRPDLAGTVFRLAPGNHTWGDEVTLDYTLSNLLPGDAAAFTVEVRLSADGTIGAEDVLLQTFLVSSLPGLSSTTGSLRVQLPSSPPAGFASQPLESVALGFVLDATNAVTEGDETNNASRGSGLDLSYLAAPANQALTTDAGVQQFPSVAVNPKNPNHIAVAYMDYTLRTTGYAGIGVKVSSDGGVTWQTRSIPLRTGFNQGAAYPTAKFDSNGGLYVTFMAATFPGLFEEAAPFLNPGKLVAGQIPSLTYPFNPLAGNDAGVERGLGAVANNGVFVARSLDGGSTWNAADTRFVTRNVVIGDFVSYDTSPDIAIDTFATLPDGRPNPNFGNMYVVFTRHYGPGQFPDRPNGAGGGEIYLAVSKDRGFTWAVQLSPSGKSVLRDPTLLNSALAPGTSVSLDPKITIGPEGDLYVTQFAGGGFPVYYSSNAGVSFRQPDRSVLNLGLPFGQANTARPPRTLDNNAFRTFPVRQLIADPARPGVVYALEAIRVVNQFTGAQVDAGELNFAYSIDHGLTWSRVFTVGNNSSNFGEVPAGFRSEFRSTLNDDDGGRFLRFDEDPRDEVVTGQALPKLAIDEAGNLAVIWYDTRHDPANHRLDVYATSSTDAGHTFAANTPLTATSFDANNGAFRDAIGQLNFYMGDLIGLAAAGGVGYAAWTGTDARTGNQDIYFARYSLTQPPAPPQDRYETNDSPEKATDLGTLVNTRVQPRLAMDEHDEDWFRVQAGATGNLVVTVSAGTQGETLLLELYDETGTVQLVEGELLTDDAGVVVGRRITVAVDAGDSYLVRVTGTTPTPLQYALTTTSLTADLGQRVNGRVDGNLKAATDRAVYRLTAGVTGTLDLTLRKLTGLTANAALEMTVFAADGVTVLARGVLDTNLSTDLITLPVEQGQELLIQVAGKSSAFLAPATGGFRVEFVNRDQFTLRTNVTLLHQVELGSIAAGTPNVIIPFTAGATGSLSFVFGALEAGRALVLDVLGADGKSVLATSGAATGFGQLQLAVEKGQVVYFRLSGTPGNATRSFFLEWRNTFNYSLTGRPTLSFAAGGLPSDVAIGDLNRDGRPDLVITSSSISDEISVLIANADGTFQAPRRYAVGAGQDAVDKREAAIADVNGDGTPDVVVTNPLSADVSILLGRGDGTFEPQRRFDTTFHAGSLAVARVNDDTFPDLIVGQNLLGTGNVSVLLGRGDGTFLPQTILPAPFPAGVVSVRTGDLNGDGKLDVAVFGRNSGQVQLLFGAGDGTFPTFDIIDSGTISITGELADLNGDGRVDLITGDLNSPTLFFRLSNGDGTFGPLVSVPAGVDLLKRGVFSIAVADVGSEAVGPDGRPASGPTDGVPDLIVQLGARNVNSPPLIVYIPGLRSNGVFTGFGAAHEMAAGQVPRQLAAGDLNGDGKADVAAADLSGVQIIYSSAPALAANTTLATARDLGTSFHLVEAGLSIVPAKRDAYFAFTVPSEPLPQSGDQVIDFSALFDEMEGAGLRMEILDATGKLLVAADRFEVNAEANQFGNRLRLVAAQGARLIIHVFALADAAGARGAGRFSLNINVLPQIVRVEAQAPLPGLAPTSLVITLQGDRLDPALAEDPRNYAVTLVTPTGETNVPLGSGARPVVYNPVARVDVSPGGQNYPRNTQHEITLLFDRPLAPGTYRVTLSPVLQTADLNGAERGVLADSDDFGGHPVVDATAPARAGVSRVLPGLVTEPVPGSLSQLPSGTPFLSQLQNDLGSLLDRLLVLLGDNPAVTSLMTEQVLARLAAGVLPSGIPVVAYWLDPVSLSLADPQNRRTVYDQKTNEVSNRIPQTYVEVGGNVELVVSAGIQGTFTLTVADVPPNARGGVVVLNGGEVQLFSLTEALRGGQTEFRVDVGRPDSPGGGGPGSGGGSGGGSSGGSTSGLQGLVATVLFGLQGDVQSLGVDSGGAGDAGGGSPFGGKLSGPRPADYSVGGEGAGLDADRSGPGFLGFGTQPLGQTVRSLLGWMSGGGGSFGFVVDAVEALRRVAEDWLQRLPAAPEEDETEVLTPQALEVALDLLAGPEPGVDDVEEARDIALFATGWKNQPEEANLTALLPGLLLTPWMLPLLQGLELAAPPRDKEEAGSRRPGLGDGDEGPSVAA